MTTLDRAALIALAERVHAQDFDHPFILTPTGDVKDAPLDVYAPTVVDGEPVQIDDTRWEALTGLSQQDRYVGAVMHPSEGIGVGVVGTMLFHTDHTDPDLARERTFVLTVVHSDDIDAEPVGWVILLLDE